MLCCVDERGIERCDRVVDRFHLCRVGIDHVTLAASPERVLGVRRACHCSFHTNGPLIDGSKKCGLRLVCISRLSERSMGPDESGGPRRQQQTGRQMGI
jgi:hypothetical protein